MRARRSIKNESIAPARSKFAIEIASGIFRRTNEKGDSREILPHRLVRSRKTNQRNSNQETGNEGEASCPPAKRSTGVLSVFSELLPTLR
jgi:hypothetical protein